MNIRTKLTITFAVLAAMVVLVAGVSLKSIADANQHFTLYVQGIKARGDTADKFRRNVDERAIAVRNLVLVDKPADLEVEKARVAQAHAQVIQYLAQLKELLAKATDVSEADRAKVAELDRIETLYTPVALAIVDLALKNRREEAVVKMNDECRPLLAALIKATDEYAAMVAVASAKLAEDENAIYEARRNLLIAACLLAVGFAAVAGVVVQRSITRPIDRAVRFAESVADGDLSSRVEAGGNDEISKLLAALSRMSLNLHGIVSSVRQSSERIATGSAQIAAGNADLSHRTEQQAGALQQTAATMEELGVTVRKRRARRAPSRPISCGRRFGWRPKAVMWWAWAKSSQR